MRIYDSSRLQNARPSPGGGILVDGRIGRSGVQTYRRPDGSVLRVLRPRAEVLAADFDGSPLTIRHPAAGVTPENYQSVSVGHARSRVRIDDVQGKVFPVHALQINAKAAIEGIADGSLAELSCCYDVEADPTPGIADGEEYDLVFRKLQPNHIALGPAGWSRAGRDAKLLIADSEDVLVSDTINEGIEDMAEISTPTDRDQLVAEITTLKAENARLQGVADSATKELETARGSLAAAQSQLDEVPQRIADGIERGVARVQKLEQARKALPNLQIADSASDEYLDGVLAAAPKGHDYNADTKKTQVADDLQTHIRAKSAEVFVGSK